MSADLGDVTEDGVDTEDSLLDTLPPEKLLVATSLKYIEPALELEDDPDVLSEYLEHERQHANREPVKRAIRAEIERTADDDVDVEVLCSPSSTAPPGDSDDQAAGDSGGDGDGNGTGDGAGAGAGDADGEPPAPAAALDTDDLDVIRETLRAIDDPGTLEQYRDHERENRTRQPVLEAIDLRLGML